MFQPLPKQLRRLFLGLVLNPIRLAVPSAPEVRQHRTQVALLFGVNNGRDFLNKFTGIAPFPIRHIQTDNGSEFLKHFAQSCLDNDFVHFFNYPRHPQSNGHIERFNRTSQEQFVDWNTDSLDDLDVFNRILMNYLIWYNTEKPHRGIGKKPPLRYYLEKFASPEKSNMLWPLTLPGSDTIS